MGAASAGVGAVTLAVAGPANPGEGRADPIAGSAVGEATAKAKIR